MSVSLSVLLELRRTGLESSNLILGVDCKRRLPSSCGAIDGAHSVLTPLSVTKSNEWTGKRTFQGMSLHHLGNGVVNPYEQAISAIGQTLEPFGE